MSKRREQRKHIRKGIKAIELTSSRKPVKPRQLHKRKQKLSSDELLSLEEVADQAQSTDDEVICADHGIHYLDVWHHSNMERLEQSRRTDSPQYEESIDYLRKRGYGNTSGEIHAYAQANYRNCDLARTKYEEFQKLIPTERLIQVMF